MGPPPSPTVAAAEATAELHLPTPTPGYWPTRSAVVNFPEWLWIDASIWHPISVSATATNAGGSTTVTATATPRYVEWHMGDSQRLAQYFGPTDIPSYAHAGVGCSGPGVVHILTQVYSTSQKTNCSFAYQVMPSEPSIPAQNFTVRPVVHWQVTWSGAAGSTGTMPDLTSPGAPFPMHVDQIEIRLCVPSTCPTGLVKIPR
ncbi:MAG: hypothetical protein M0Z82_08890 [Actinomycetota bacterium]|nr:hypothetical protein [Actinomycetota bacterium]